MRSFEKWKCVSLNLVDDISDYVGLVHGPPVVAPIYKLAKTCPHSARGFLYEVRHRSIPAACVCHWVQHTNVNRRLLPDLVDLESDHVRDPSRKAIPSGLSHREALWLQKGIDGFRYSSTHGSW
jgi:hypothetical protein